MAASRIFFGGAIALIGALNLLGPKHTGALAVVVSVLTAAVVLVLGAFVLPHLREAWHSVQPLTGGPLKNWNGFVSIVLALSGVEANATGIMKLDPGSTPEKPNVRKTTIPAILWVALEVCVFTALLGLAMSTLPGLHTVPGDVSGPDVDAPDANGVRDYMLKYMGQIFVGHALGQAGVSLSARSWPSCSVCCCSRL